MFLLMFLIYKISKLMDPFYAKKRVRQLLTLFLDYFLRNNLPEATFVPSTQRPISISN